jgi:acetoin:2,6-dichlorophenolindophenol oxidoreductase subunit beta
MNTVLNALNSALKKAMESDQRVILIGEDLLDPYGGAFKVTRGLSSAFPDRVLPTPISEAGIVGLATGMAMRGLRPVVEIMFGDFVTLVADQVINHAAKFSWMYNEQVKVPLVIRTPMGGRRGYGPTHSQSLEKHFLGVPGLRVLAPSSLGDPGKLLLQAIHSEEVVLFVENKLLYAVNIKEPAALPDFEIRQSDGDTYEMGSVNVSPSYTLTIKGAPQPVLTLATYGYMAELAIEAAFRLAFDHEIFIELVVLTQLAPFRLEPVLTSVGKTGRLLAAEEGNHALGWGAEVVAQAAETLGSQLRKADRLGALNLPIPSSSALEQTVLPSTNALIHKAIHMVKGSNYD